MSTKNMRETYEDRLTDLALAEKFQCTSTPDFADQILDAAEIEKPTLAPEGKRRGWLPQICVASALVLIAGGIYALPHFRQAEEHAMTEAPSQPVQQVNDVEQPVREATMGAQVRREVKQRVATLERNFEEAMNEERFAEAASLVAQAESINPTDPVVVSMKWKQRFAKRFVTHEATRNEKEQGLVSALVSINESAIPFDDRGPLRFTYESTWADPSRLHVAPSTETGRFMFGVGTNSDAGLTGGIRPTEQPPRPPIFGRVYAELESERATTTLFDTVPEPPSLPAEEQAHQEGRKVILSVLRRQLSEEETRDASSRAILANLAKKNTDLSQKTETAKQSAVASILKARIARLREEIRTHSSPSGDRFATTKDNDFTSPTKAPLSTFSIDVDTASYTKVRMYLQQQATRPPVDAVRIEELVNYFRYNYDPPKENDEKPFATHIEVAGCPWQPKHRLVKIGLKGKVIEQRPVSNLVFLIDVSGSMSSDNKLPLLKHGLSMLTQQLGENDRVAIVVYAGAAGMVLPSTSGDEQSVILGALEKLQAGGSTAGGAGIQLAYQTAKKNFIKGGVNRVILCTDGDFNVGVTDTDELVSTAEQQAKKGVSLSVLGFGMGNHNDSMLEKLSNSADGNYAFIDNRREAYRVLVEQIAGTLVTIAKDVKVQVEFNPSQVASYRLIGYANRLLAKEDFNDDTKDAGEIGAGHTVTALYEIVPEVAKRQAEVDELRYQPVRVQPKTKLSQELLTVKMRYKLPGEKKSKLAVWPIIDKEATFAKASNDFRFAASVASFGMLLRNSKYRGNATLDQVMSNAESAVGTKALEDRLEFLDLVRRAKTVN